jgi:lipase chaperone LimK
MAAATLVVRLVSPSTADSLDRQAAGDVERSTLSRQGGGGDLAAVSASAAPMRSAAQPHSLAGSAAPRLPLDVRGHLGRTRAVRDFFDYFLTASHEVPSEALDAMVRRAIGAQLEGSAAQSEALDVWRRYRAYLAALAGLAPLQANASGSTAGLDADALQTAFDACISLARRTMGAAWSEAFFGDEWRTTAYSLARLRIASDRTLTGAQRAARLEAWRQSLPPEERESLEREAKAQATVNTIAELIRQDPSTDGLRARATQALGAQAAERIVQMREQDERWRARYADYAIQRAQIDAMGLGAEERDARVTHLRERMFSTVGERVRAAALDAGQAR